MKLGLDGRIALVTGGTGGIGRAVAAALAAEGARVAITYRTDREGAEKLAAELDPAGSAAMALPYSLEEPDSPAAVLGQVERRWSGVDVLVTCAMRWGVRRPPGTRFEDVAAAEWEPVVAENLAPTIRTVQRAVPGMRANGWGRIVLISSHVARDGHRGQEFYAAAKSGLHGFARSLAWDLGQSGILVNVVSPGLTGTDRVLTGLPEPIRQGELARTPTGRLSSPADVAAVVAFLASAANGNVTGEVVTVSGGR
ncbi:SDR family NAD(P)-dependent oxidoreductase [Nonomuraea sp. NPDC049158]|uniref:SDR family NAD(P)-dependent oxidoreductase n=1 Tax=Nonomuraea sp. NPDC049158 TaxID=3155649 RepID=UPI0033D25950